VHCGIQQVREPIGDHAAAAFFETARVDFHVSVGIAVNVLASIGHGGYECGQLSDQTLKECGTPQEAANLPNQLWMIGSSKPSLEIVHEVRHVPRAAFGELPRIERRQGDEPLQAFIVVAGTRLWCSSFQEVLSALPYRRATTFAAYLA
jgi:hypothetical protein